MKQIEGFQNYFVTESGMVYNSIRKAFLKPYKDTDGYLELRLGAGNKRKVHRLVAQAFIPNPLNKPQVNHKYGVKTDNRASQLEWATHAENMQHAWNTGLVKSSDKHKQSTKDRARKLVLDLATGIFYESALEASYYSGINYSTLRANLNGATKNRTSFIYA